MTRYQFIEQILRQVYGGYVQEDSSITPMLVNQYIDQAIAFAAKTNYKENASLEGVGFVNNSFYTTFKDIAISKDELNLWRITLPQVPVGVGANEGVSTLQLKDGLGRLSQPCIPLTENQKTYFQSLRNLPFKTLYYVEGNQAFLVSNLKLSDFTATVTLVSGGNSSDLNSNLNVPGDYVPIMIDYIQKQLLLMKSTPKDLANDGQDISLN